MPFLRLKEVPAAKRCFEKHIKWEWLRNLYAQITSKVLFYMLALFFPSKWANTPARIVPLMEW